MSEYRVAIVGATGLVGTEFIKVLTQRGFAMSSVDLLASERSAGKRLQFGEREIEVKETTARSFEGVDIALFSAGASVSRRFAPDAVNAGAVVIDNSSAFRMDADVPLVVPEVNADDIRLHRGIIANPNCSTIQMVVALDPLHRRSPVRRIVVDTYQSVSGAKTVAVEELTEQTRQVLDGQPVSPRVFRHQVAFNVLPEIDAFMENAYTREEWKMVEETRKIMHAPEIAISATCVRVPVFVGHSEAIHVEFARPMAPAEARDVLARAPGVKVIDDPSASLYPQAWSAAGTDDVFVGRIRQDASHPGGLAMWIVCDNVRKGAALNAVQIAEEMTARGWLQPSVPSPREGQTA